MTRSTILVLGPHREALSGVSTHLRLLFGSRLARDHLLLHFQVGSEGRREGRLARLARCAGSPFALARAILGHGVALVHVNTSLNRRAFLRDLAYMAVARLCGARVLCQVHGGALPQHFVPAWLRGLLRAALGLPHLIAVLAREELAAYRAFLPRQFVVLLPNGVDCASLSALPRRAARPGAPLRLVYMGRLVKEKGILELLQALRLAVSEGCRLKLVVAGDGPDGAALRQYAADLGIAPLVSFVESVSGEDKTCLLAESDVLVLVSYAEGMPYALLEGMAAGTAVVATRVGAIPDVVIEGVHGLLVPARDPQAIQQALARLSADRELLGRMSAACRKRIVAAFSVERLAASLGSVYSVLCSGGAGEAARLGPDFR